MAVDAASVTSGLGDALSWVFLLALIAVVMSVVGYLGWWFYRYMRYDIKVSILEPMGANAWRERIDMAREDRKMKHLELRGYREFISIPGPQFFLLSGKRRSLKFVEVSGYLLPMEITMEWPPNYSVKMEKLSIAVAWRENSRKESLSAYSETMGFMEKYGTVVVSSMTMIMMFVLFFILINQMQGGVTVTAVLDNSQLINTG